MLKRYVVLLLTLAAVVFLDLGVLVLRSIERHQNTSSLVAHYRTPESKKQNNDHVNETTASPPSHTVLLNQSLPNQTILNHTFEVACQLEREWSLMPVECRVAKYQQSGKQPLFHESFVATFNQKTQFDEPQLPQFYCELILLHTHLCHRNESASKCVRRVGAQRLELVLPARCTQSKWFQGIVAEEKVQEVVQRTYRSQLYPLLSGGIIPDSIMQPVEPPQYIPPDRRPSANMPPPRKWPRLPNCSYVYRLPMSIPEEVIVDSVERDKFFDFYPMLPSLFPIGGFKVRNSLALGPQDEVVTRELAARSFFAWTHRRGCWTAQRHLDILASGSVPFFFDLNRCRDFDVCLPGYPARLVQRALRMSAVAWMLSPQNITEFIAPPYLYTEHPVFNVLKPGRILHDRFDRPAYFRLADELLEYTKKHLTTKAIAAHFLRAMGVENATTVFATVYWWLPHTVGLMHGLAALGVDVITPTGHGFPRLPPNTTAAEQAKALYTTFWPGHRGSGHMYGMKADRNHFTECGDCTGPRGLHQVAENQKN